ncbi:MAG: hypothetical protein QHI48_11355 [Bacteroidota bacterium]|nr:hypothetical protein [Bacteroidota bacterium]
MMNEVSLFFRAALPRAPAALGGLAVVLTAAALGIAASVLGGCDGGLSPEMGRVGFEGRVRVVSPWPPRDSIYALRVVAIRSYPPGDLIQEFLEGKLVFSDELPRDLSEFSYRIQQENLQGVFAFVAVAQQFGPNPFQDWRAVGVYSVSGDPGKPTPIDLGSGRWLTGIDITVDFYTPLPL